METLRKLKNVKQPPRDEKLEKEYQDIAALPAQQVLENCASAPEGLSGEDAAHRLQEHGKNATTDNRKKPWYHFFLLSFKDEFIIVLLLLGVISLILGDTLGGGIIFLLAFLSAMLRFVQDYRAYLASESLRQNVTNVDVWRDGQLCKVPGDELVVGDKVLLGSGTVVPADLYLVRSKDLFVAQSVFTGESVSVEKKAGADTSGAISTDLNNICLMGASVISGTAEAVVIKTGKATYLGHIAAGVEEGKGQTAFEKGLSQVTQTLVKYMGFVVVVVFIINGVVKQDWLQAFMFSLSVAVGITPGMLPMIVNATLAKGAQFMAKKNIIVKNMSAIQNFGAMDVLCTDKTGTLTLDSVVLQRYINVRGEEDISVLEDAYFNSHFSTGVKNLIDNAILAYGAQHGMGDRTGAYRKIDEIPFDFERRRMSVVVENAQGEHHLITKGALEEVLKACAFAQDGEDVVSLSPEMVERITAHADELNSQGMHVIAIATRDEQIDVSTFSSQDETGMTFIGYVAFLDPPKPDVKEAVEKLYAAGVDIKIITGDAALVAENICAQVGIARKATLLGSAIEGMDDKTLSQAVEGADLFARVSPMQKQRIVDALRANGHVVGYMGDGVNDAPSLRHADVGISVDTATDIAKQSSDIILLEKSLLVLFGGVYEGRRIYGNIMKYMKMSLSSNFGNVFSVLVASILLPFLPMIPIQMLIQNLIYDFTQIAIPWDNVDEEFVRTPKKWDTKSLMSFMNSMGITSSVFDMLTFAALWFIMGFQTTAQETYFQTGWFMEGLISQTLIVHFIRTAKIPFLQSRADWRLSLATLGGILGALAVPFLLHAIPAFHFALMPARYYPLLALIILGYAVTIEVVKKAYIRKHGSWL